MQVYYEEGWDGNFIAVPAPLGRPWRKPHTRRWSDSGGGLDENDDHSPERLDLRYDAPPTAGADARRRGDPTMRGARAAGRGGPAPGDPRRGGAGLAPGGDPTIDI